MWRFAIDVYEKSGGIVLRTSNEMRIQLQLMIGFGAGAVSAIVPQLNFYGG